MISAISGVSNSYFPVYAVQNNQKTGGIWTTQRGAMPEAAVEPVSPVRPADEVNANQRKIFQQQLPAVREGADPVEMAVRMRIQYPQSGEEAGAPARGEAAGTMKLPGEPKSERESPAPKSGAALGASDIQKAAEEGRCETCEKRKYQDGSDDPGVSFKTPANIAPEQAAGAVRGHEMEHVVREQSKARREDRKVVSQSVTYHTGICPECGKAYVSGGTTRTVTAANNRDADLQQEAEQENRTRTPFSAVA